MTAARQSTGIAALDEKLGGGLIPGALTVVVGATGVGKTQLGIQFAAAGQAAEGHRGVIFDMSSRGDSQSHADYARRLFDWQLTAPPPVAHDEFFDRAGELGDYLHIFDYTGRRVTRSEMDWDQWRAWQAEINVKLSQSIGFLYGAFVRGVQRVVVDGIEPVDRPGDSVQFNLFEYVYHQVVRKDPQWVARDLFRQDYRRHSAAAAERIYDPRGIGCLLLYTSHEMMLDELVSRSLDQGDVLSNANTLILMGKIRDGMHIRRALYIAKHRGSACSEEIVPFEIGEEGLQVG